MGQRVLFRLWPFVKRYWLLYVVIGFLMLVGIATELAFAWFLTQVTDAAVIQDSVAVWRVFYFGIGVTAAMGLQAYGSAVLRQKADGRLQRDVKGRVFHHVLRLPVGKLQQMSSGDLVSRLTNDIQAMGSAVGTGLINLIRDPLAGLIAFVYLLRINWMLALLTGSVGPLSILLGALFGKAMRRNAEKLQGMLGAQNGFLNDVLTALPVVKAFCAESRLFGTYSKDNDRIVDIQVQDARLRGSLDAGLFVLMLSSFLLTLGVGGIFVAQGKLTVGTLVAFLFLIQRVTQPFQSFSHYWGRLQRSLAASQRIFDILDVLPETDRLALPVPSKTEAVRIELKGIDFAYERDGAETEEGGGDGVFSPHNVLSDFSVTIEPGQVVALVGPSGAGKTTVFHLLLGFWRPDAGDILMNGQSIHTVDQAEWRSMMAVVPQETSLFRGTVRDNIAFGRPDASDDAIVDAAKMANAHEFISEFPDGYATELGERGQRLSGGQRQRIAIARALLRDAPILLLDEATSALDVESEAAVQQALGRLMSGRTTLVIAHRLTTVHNADRILVMEQGLVVEEGDHATLMARDGRYATLYRKQFGEESSDGERIPLPRGV